MAHPQSECLVSTHLATVLFMKANSTPITSSKGLECCIIPTVLFATQEAGRPTASMATDCFTIKVLVVLATRPTTRTSVWTLLTAGSVMKVSSIWTRKKASGRSICPTGTSWAAASIMILWKALAPSRSSPATKMSMECGARTYFGSEENKTTHDYLFWIHLKYLTNVT